MKNSENILNTILNNNKSVYVEILKYVKQNFFINNEKLNDKILIHCYADKNPKIRSTHRRIPHVLVHKIR
jgi:hypothetical protein